ncbi:hypothetical protein NZK32_11035 [Cyanobium sp. FGCU-52]|nr:hypothetical protein [Cyanobium sp. FGCU52]
MRLICWQPAEQSQQHPDRVIAQLLQRAEPGWFSPRSWNDGQQKIGLAASSCIPPLPQRRFGA